MRRIRMAVRLKGGRAWMLVLPAMLLMSAISANALAAPVKYMFSTGVKNFNNFFSPNGLSVTEEERQAQTTISNSIAAHLEGSTVSGTFVYDNAAPWTQATTGGATGNRASVYGGHLRSDGTPYSSYTDLSATVNAPMPRTITDPRGFTIVGDDDVQGLCFMPGCTPPVFDFFTLNADNTTGTTFRNLVGYTIGDYKVWNVRLFWQEGLGVFPDLVRDFLNNADEPAVDPLLSAPPAMKGRLAIDFVHVTNVDGMGFQYGMFYDGLLVTVAIPEPKSYALFLAGLALLGFTARRRREKRRINLESGAVSA
jgi:PEP-CTERM motif